jgi:hypothetical protein
METWIEQLSMAICDRPAGISRSLYRDLAVVTEAEIGSKHTCVGSIYNLALYFCTNSCTIFMRQGWYNFYQSEPR